MTNAETSKAMEGSIDDFLGSLGVQLEQPLLSQGLDSNRIVIIFSYFERDVYTHCFAFDTSSDIYESQVLERLKMEGKGVPFLMLPPFEFPSGDLSKFCSYFESVLKRAGINWSRQPPKDDDCSIVGYKLAERLDYEGFNDICQDAFNLVSAMSLSKR